MGKVVLGVRAIILVAWELHVACNGADVRKSFQVQITRSCILMIFF